MLDKKNPFRVCILLPSKFPAIGGYENLVYLLVQSLSKKVEVHVVCTGLSSTIPIPKNVKVHAIPPVTNIRVIGFILNNLLNQFRVLRLARKHKFDFFHAHPSFPPGLIALLAKTLLKIPLVCTSHGADIQVDPKVGYGSRNNKVISWLVKLVLKNTDLHTVVSKSMIEDAIDAGSTPSKLRVVYNGINLDSILRGYNSQSLKKYGIEAEDFVILFLSRLHPKKCPEDLVKAFPKVVEKVPNAKLIFAGKGEEESKLKQLTTKLNLNNNIVSVSYTHLTLPTN